MPTLQATLFKPQSYTRAGSGCNPSLRVCGWRCSSESWSEIPSVGNHTLVLSGAPLLVFARSIPLLNRSRKRLKGCMNTSSTQRYVFTSLNSGSDTKRPIHGSTRKVRSSCKHIIIIVLLTIDNQLQSDSNASSSSLPDNYSMMVHMIIV